MQKDNRYYTFLLSHTTKEKIYIRRLEVSKKLLHSSVVSLFLCVGLVSIGVFGLINTSNNTTLAKNESQAPVVPVSQSSSVTSSAVRNKVIDYQRVETSDEYSLNSGGPRDFQLTKTNAKGEEEKEIEKKLLLIEKTTSPEYLPTIWAHLGKINNEFGFRRNPFGGRSYEFHQGLDIDGDRGDMIVAPANGVVVKANWKGGYGKFIEIDHGNGLSTRYGHLSRLEIREGDTVKRGQLIGLVGSTGRSTGPHLHYELRLDDKPINPRRFLPPEPRDIKK